VLFREESNFQLT